MMPMRSIVRAVLALIGILLFSSAVGGQDPDYVVTIGDATGAPGSEVTLPLTLSVAASGPVQGFSFSFLAPDDRLTPQEVLLGSALAALNGGAGPALLSVQLYTDPGGTGIACGTVFDLFGIDTLGLGTHPALDMVWTIDPSAVSPTTGVEFCDCLGTPPIPSVIVVGGFTIIPTLVPSTVTIASTPPFKRGDSNASGAIDIADAIYAINYLFLSGPSVCPDAMDANHDGAVDLADALYLLLYINSLGPAPDFPFPSCGTAALLGCDEYGAC